jgi:hypothetical protein
MSWRGPIDRHAVRTGRQPSIVVMKRQLAPVFLLAVLSPVIAEFLLGDQYLAGPPSFAQIGMLVLYVLFYGCGAILVRELARRSGRGWPTIVLLALAFGVIEEGLVTQSLFNQNYLGAHLLDYGYLSALGIAPPWTVFVLALHTVWSISSPIAVVEGRWGVRPWLGRVGLAVVTVLYVLGAVATFAITLLLLSNSYVAPLPLLLAAAVVAAVLVVIAFRLPRVAGEGRRPNWAGFVFGLLASSAFLLLAESDDALPWAVATLLLVVIAAAAVVAIVRWHRLDPFALGAGAVVAYCWHGMPTAVEAGPAAVVEQVVIVVLVVALLAVLARRTTGRVPA